MYSDSGLFDVAYGEVNWRTIVDTAANRQSQEPTPLPPYDVTYSTNPKSQTGYGAAKYDRITQSKERPDFWSFHQVN